MTRLAKNWITEGSIDFEYKKYVLLAYLQKVQEEFHAFKLYPFLSDLVDHYRHANSLKEGKAGFQDQLPKELIGLDMKNMLLQYKQEAPKNDYLNEIDDIINFAIPQMQHSLDTGKERYEELESNLDIFTVGLIPNYNEEGFLFLSVQNGFTDVYQYRVGVVQLIQDQFRSIQTQFVRQYPISMINNYYKIRKDVINEFGEFDSPMTVVMESKLPVPIKETFLPVAKKSLISYLANVA